MNQYTLVNIIDVKDSFQMMSTDEYEFYNVIESDYLVGIHDKFIKTLSQTEEWIDNIQKKSELEKKYNKIPAYFIGTDIKQTILDTLEEYKSNPDLTQDFPKSYDGIIIKLFVSLENKFESSKGLLPAPNFDIFEILNKYIYWNSLPYYYYEDLLKDYMKNIYFLKFYGGDLMLKLIQERKTVYIKETFDYFLKT
ncbi:5828_t:CDS:2, partial [Racocetra fulgida]